MGAGLDLSPGAVVARDFRVVRPLAEGGMGAVYVVEQLSTGKTRALKVMHARFAADPRSRERFAQEARASAHVASDHVVEVVAAGVDEASSAPWMVMELLDGETLDAALARRGALPPDEVAEVFAQLGHALGAAHAAGLVHRDLKPENVVLATPRRAGARFTVKVLDFGIAKLLTEAMGTNTQAIGSPHWMAPEQTVEGSVIGAPTDVWALGLIAYNALTGVEFWRAAQDDVTLNGVSLFVEIGAEPIPPATQRATEQGRARLLPAGFDAWFARCVTRPITDRFENGAVATDALLALLRAPAPAVAPVDAALPFAPTVGQPVYTPTLAQTAEVAEPVALVGPVLTQLSMVVPTPPVPYTPTAPLVAYAPSLPPRRSSRWGWWALGALALVGVGVAVSFALGFEPYLPTPAPTPAPVAPTMPFVAGRRWVGSYVCADARTPFILHVNAVAGMEVAAVFEFPHPESNSTGAYEMRGSYDPDARRLPLAAGAWLRQPPGFEAVSMDGVVAPDGMTYAGQMLDPRCSEFSLRLDD